MYDGILFNSIRYIKYVLLLALFKYAAYSWNVYMFVCMYICMYVYNMNICDRYHFEPALGDP